MGQLSSVVYPPEWKPAARAAIGALAITFGTVLANAVNHVYLSPLLFSLGIVLVIVLNLDLVTRAVPSGVPYGECAVILVFNLLVAALAGLLLRTCGTFPPSIKPSFFPAVATGIIIGLVSLVNIKQTSYTVPATLMLMFSFVYLKLPHCVVCAFYYGASPVNALRNLPGLLSVVAGNLIGGLIIRYLFILCKKLEKDEP